VFNSKNLLLFLYGQKILYQNFWLTFGSDSTRPSIPYSKSNSQIYVEEITNAPLLLARLHTISCFGRLALTPLFAGLRHFSRLRLAQPKLATRYIGTFKSEKN